MRIAVYPGSFDPVTNGHIDIIKRGAKLFDHFIVAVLNNISKKSLFTVQERMDMLFAVTQDFEGVEVDCFSGLLIDYMKKKNANVAIRGLRAVSDFEYEFQMALMNRKLGKDIETIFMMTSTRYSFLSSSIIKEVAMLGGCVKELVPDMVEQKLFEKFKI